jgi:AhpC/TSA family
MWPRHRVARMTIVGSQGAGTLEEATGWVLKPEGLCRDETCVNVPPDVQRDPVAVWSRLGWPVARSGPDVYLGEPASTRSEALASTIAPDFTLRDLDGREHSLSDHRGKKVFLVSWAPY